MITALNVKEPLSSSPSSSSSSSSSSAQMHAILSHIAYLLFSLTRFSTLCHNIYRHFDDIDYDYLIICHVIYAQLIQVT